MDSNDAAILRGAAVPTVVAGVIVAVVAWVIGGVDALVGAALGTLVVLGFCGVGLFVILRVRGRNPYALLNVALLTYLVKVLVLAGLLVALKDTTAFDTKAFGWAILVGVLVWTGFEVRAFNRLKVFYVEPVDHAPDHSGPGGA
jgi:ATP synthase protein I